MGKQPMDTRHHRRRVGSIAVTAALIVSLIAALPATLATTDARPAGQRLMLDMTGWERDTEVVAPAHLAQPRETRWIGPGTHLLIERGSSTFGCTAAFVFKGTKVINGIPDTRYYLGSAGHCFLPADSVASHGVGADYRAYKYNRVYACIRECQSGGQVGFRITGELVRLGNVSYARQTGSGGDVGNDFGLVHIPKALVKYIRRTMPVWGGPKTTQNISLGSITCHYGNGFVLGETFVTMGRAGTGVFAGRSYWEAAHPIAPGDSGSAMNTCVRDSTGVHGRGAAGVVTHGIGVGPHPMAYAFGTTVPRGIQLARQAGIALVIQYGR
jgi:hypothetical protein